MRYLITGGSGYIGSRLVDRLRMRDDTESIVIADVVPPRSFRPQVEYRELDVTDRARVHEVISEVRPDVLLHLAFILNPMHDERRMYEIDVGGTQNVLEAASDAGVQQLFVTSSASAYGAFPDNPVPITEDHPVRGAPAYEYARDKAECDRLCQLWALQHPERTMTIVRPCIVFGPNVDNYILRLWTKQPFLADTGLPDPPIQYVHEDDIVEAITLLVEGGHAGAYNVAGDGTMTVGECAELVGLRRQRFPLGLFRRFVAVLWRMHLSEAPEGQVDFAIYPWVVSTDKLKRDAGWQPRYSSRETFELTMQAHGVLPAPAPAPTPLPEPALPEPAVARQRRFAREAEEPVTEAETAPDRAA